MTADRYKGRDLGPYRRFRTTKFYGGCFTADTMICNWTCSNCWSKFGWRTQDPTFELDSDEVVKRILRGMRRQQLAQGRISGGEPSLFWDSHMRLVVEKFLEASIGEMIGKGRKREAPYLVLETNGTLLTPKRIERLEDAVGDEGNRFMVTVGMKASNVDAHMALTGQKRKTAESFRRKMVELIEFMAQPDRIVDLNIVFLDAYCEESELEEFGDWLETIDVGRRDSIDLQKFFTTSWGSKQHTEKHYTPKRHREEQEDV